MVGHETGVRVLMFEFYYSLILFASEFFKFQLRKKSGSKLFVSVLIRGSQIIYIYIDGSCADIEDFWLLT